MSPRTCAPWTLTLANVAIVARVRGSSARSTESCPSFAQPG